MRSVVHGGKHAAAAALSLKRERHARGTAALALESPPETSPALGAAGKGSGVLAGVRRCGVTNATNATARTTGVQIFGYYDSGTHLLEEVARALDGRDLD